MSMEIIRKEDHAQFKLWNNEKKKELYSGGNLKIYFILFKYTIALFYMKI